MMRVLIDLNLVLDVLLDRQPHADASMTYTAGRTGPGSAPPDQDPLPPPPGSRQ